MRSDDGSARWEFKVSDLLEKLQENLEIHIKEFEEAREGYLAELEEKLDNMLKEVREAGIRDEVNTYIDLEKPRSHEKDYERIIEVLEMTTAKTVHLTLGEFDKYVRDNWEWTDSFKMSNSKYR